MMDGRGSSVDLPRMVKYLPIFIGNCSSFTSPELPAAYIEFTWQNGYICPEKIAYKPARQVEFYNCLPGICVTPTN